MMSVALANVACIYRRHLSSAFIVGIYRVFRTFDEEGASGD